MSRSFVFLIITIITGVILSIATLFDASPTPSAFNDFNDHKKYTITIDKIPILVEVAHTPEQREKGLSGREFLPMDEGLLFIFNESKKYAFWMKNMHFPIDIIWINEKFLIVDIIENISPASFPEIFEPQKTARYVLEINAGWAAKNGIHFGMFVDGLQPIPR